jgi:hypothetical protein
MPKHTQLKYVWPKDGPKGRGRRGFFGRLNDILTGRGPDIFLDKESSTRPIKADHWGNWYLSDRVLPGVITYFRQGLLPLLRLPPR